MVVNDVVTKKYEPRITLTDLKVAKFIVKTNVLSPEFLSYCLNRRYEYYFLLNGSLRSGGLCNIKCVSYAKMS